jgi:hypothetical protein
MTGVGREEDLVLRLARKQHLAVGDRSGGERRVDDDAIVARRERVQLSSAHAEPPPFLVVRGSVRDEIRIRGMREHVLPKLVEAQRRVDGRAVVQDVEARVGEVDHTLPVRPVDPGGPDVPLVRDDPVENMGPGRCLDDLERNVSADEPKRLTEPLARDAPTEREHLSHSRMDRVCCFSCSGYDGSV